MTQYNDNDVGRKSTGASASAIAEKSARGMFGPISGPGGRTLDPGSVRYKEGKREKQLVDMDELPVEYKEAVEADHFIIYGKASVEQYDEDGQRVDIEALDSSLEQLFRSGNISRRHKDVRVGEPLPEWELEEDKDVDIDGETFAFEAGDTLATGANPGVVSERRDGEPDDDEFWIVADLWDDTEIGKDTRLRCLSGDLNGFSVTIYAKKTERTPEGEDVTDLDWHAVTIGSDEAIKNKDSRFGLADYKAVFGITDDSATGDRVKPAGARADSPDGGRTMFEGLLNKAGDEAGFNGELLAAASAATEKAQTSGVDLKQAAEETASDASFKADDVMNTISVLQADTKASGDDLEEILVGVENGDLSADEAVQMVQQADAGDDADVDPEKPVEMADTMTKGEDKDEDEDYDEEEAPEEEKECDDEEELEEKLSQMLDDKGVVTEDELDEKLEAQGDRLVDTVASKLDEAVPTPDAIAEKMETGSTGSPQAGSGSNERDYRAEMRAAYDGGDGE